MHMEVSVMAQAASLETAEHGLPGEHGSNKHTVENTYGIPTGSLIWALASHQISSTFRHVWAPECWRTRQGLPG